VVWRWDNDPFGLSAANEDPDGDTVSFEYGQRFLGQYFDAESGRTYNYFRNYDSAVGRYLESDPIGLAGGANTYQYVDGNPTAMVDPVGLTAVPATLPGPVFPSATAAVADAASAVAAVARMPVAGVVEAGAATAAGAAGAVAGAGYVGWEIGSLIYPHIAIPLGDAIDSCAAMVKARIRRGRLSACLDACASKDASGGRTWTQFCNKLKDAQARAICFSHQFDSETACRGYCFNEFGKH
jgi:RHS repeat-associated protein